MKRIHTSFIILLISFITLNSLAQNPCHFAGYRCDTINYSYTAITGDTLFGMPDDTYSPAVPIGFTFRFYDTDYTSLLISNNGFLSFNTYQADSSSPWYISVSIPSPNNPLNAIFGPYQDLYNVAEGTIHYQTIGTMPNRRFIVSYDSIPMLMCSAEYFSGQTILYETSNNIEIHINSKLLCSNWNSGLAIEGVQNATGTMATAAPGRNSPQQWIANHDGRRFSPVNGPFPAPELCMVTVDTATNSNLIIWNQPAGIVIDSFMIYREVNNSGNYTLLATQPRTAFSTFTDFNSYPGQTFNRYKLTFMDSCGIISLLSPNHKTMHLVLSQGSGTSWNLDWDAYEGFPIANYLIYRGSSPGTMTLLSSVANTILSYNDASPPAGTVYYSIQINGAGGCSPSVRMASINYNVSMSNTAATNTIGLPAISGIGAMVVTPNPSDGRLRIISNTASEIVTLSVVNILGLEVLKFPTYGMIKGGSELDISSLPNGIYFLKIANQSGMMMQRISILK